MAQQVESLTKLLKQHNAETSAVAANKIMLAAGVPGERTRPGSRDPGKTKKFKVLTALERKFGDNIQNELSPETTPKYYIDQFPAPIAKYLKSTARVIPNDE